MAATTLTNLLEVSHQRNEVQNLPPWNRHFSVRHCAHSTRVTVLVWRWTKGIYSSINTGGW